MASLCLPYCLHWSTFSLELPWLAILKYLLAVRAQEMVSKAFTLLPPEESSMITVDIRLYSLIVLHCGLLPVLQIGLALPYFKYGQAWARVLR